MAKRISLKYGIDIPDLENVELRKLQEMHDNLFSKIHKQIKDRTDLVNLLEMERELTRRETE